MGKAFSAELGSLQPRENLWENFILGVLNQFETMGTLSQNGFDCLISSNLPIGSGVSSSAALMCGLAKGIDVLYATGLSDEEIVLLAQRAEHQYAGTNCGVMDQFAVMKGVKDGLLFLDCNTLKYSVVKANFDPYELLLLNSNVSHNLAGTEYNRRRAECEEALAIIRQTYPEYSCLAEVPKAVLMRFRRKMDPKLYQRARFVVEEDFRVRKAVKRIRKKQFTEFGNLMYASHEGLSRLYEVSCPEIDFLVDFTKADKRVIGSRMMGGGFGGCTLNLIEKKYRAKFHKAISKAYMAEFGRELLPIPVSPGAGVTVMQ
jgi:galactokinase